MVAMGTECVLVRTSAIAVLVGVETNVLFLYAGNYILFFFTTQNKSGIPNIENPTKGAGLVQSRHPHHMM
jgi:hypothetical protein